MTDSTGVLDPLDGKSPNLFLVAGILLVVFATNTGARVFADSGFSAVHSIVGPAGFFAGLVGLLGLHPDLMDRTPKSAHFAAIVTAIPTVGWFVIAVFGIGNAVGVLPGMSVVFPVPIFPILVVLTTILSYLLFGASSLRAGINSRAANLVLLLPVIPFVMLIAGVAILGPIEWMEFVIDTGHALAHLAVGITLRSEGIPPDSTKPAAETTP